MCYKVQYNTDPTGELRDSNQDYIANNHICTTKCRFVNGITCDEVTGAFIWSRLFYIGSNQKDSFILLEKKEHYIN